MSSSSEMSGKNVETSELQTMEDEHARLVLPNESRIANFDSQQVVEKTTLRSYIWWMKILFFCFLLVVLSFVFVKWGLPFAFEKVLLPIMEWEATAFGRPVLALVLIGSLALFPVLLIPSGPSMWLAGMIFGYGLGFLIIMVGTTIGMVLPYFIGLLFRERIHRTVDTHTGKYEIWELYHDTGGDSLQHHILCHRHCNHDCLHSICKASFG